MKNKELAKYIKDLKAKKDRLEFELAEVNDELHSIASLSITGVSNNSINKCSLCDGEGEINDRWAGLVPCPECKGRGYK